MIYENYSRASKRSHNLFSFLITPGAWRLQIFDSVRVPPNTVRFGGSSEQVWFPDLTPCWSGSEHIWASHRCAISSRVRVLWTRGSLGLCYPSEKTSAISGGGLSLSEPFPLATPPLLYLSLWSSQSSRPLPHTLGGPSNEGGESGMNRAQTRLQISITSVGVRHQHIKTFNRRPQIIVGVSFSTVYGREASYISASGASCPTCLWVEVFM